MRLETATFSPCLLLLLSASPAPTEACPPGHRVTLDLARWRAQAARKSDRCEALVAAQFDVGTGWACRHGRAPRFSEGDWAADFIIASELPTADRLLCVGADKGRCKLFVALRGLE